MIIPPHWDLAKLHGEFPILSRTVHGEPLCYLDNAATTQKPRSVIDRIDSYYRTENANIHRGVHYLSQIATDAYESAREQVRGFINAPSVQEIIFTRGATDSINLVAASFGGKYVKAGDEVLVSALEHHSNIVPWQLLTDQVGAKLRVIPMTQSGDLDLSTLDELLTPRTRIVGVTYVSNALGTVNPVAEIIRRAHAKSIPVLVDAAQAVPHIPIDVQALDCDFLAFSGHKMYGPTGIGVLFGRKELLEAMPPYQGGGDMILSVSFKKTTYNALPYKFEAGTPHISGAIGLGAAVTFMERLGMKSIAHYESSLTAYALNELSKLEGFRPYGTPRLRASVISFAYGDIHPHDLGTILDKQGVAIRTGHHCAQPVMEYYGIPATARASFAVYNTIDDVARLVAALKEANTVFANV